MDKCTKIAALYIATLRAMTIIHQFNHWTTRGSNFYGEHLLFERIYDSALKDIDLAAEKFIGLMGDDCLNYDLQTDLLHKILLKFKSLEGSPTEMSLSIEKEFLKLSKGAYDCFKEEGKMTLGLDDMIMAIASSREESVYLLQQTLRG
jgi:DNA-binding ferritin-like protein